MVEQSFAALEVRRHFGQPNRGFDGFDLTKERTDAAERVVPPMLEEARRFRADLPMGGVGQGPPCIHVLAHFIDDGGGIVLLFPSGQALPLVEHHLGLPDLFPFLRLRNGRDELCGATGFDCLLCGLSIFVQFPVALWAFVGRVQDGVVKEWVGHFLFNRYSPTRYQFDVWSWMIPRRFLVNRSEPVKTVPTVSAPSPGRRLRRIAAVIWPYSADFMGGLLIGAASATSRITRSRSWLARQ